MSTKKFVYSNEELRQLKPTKNNTSNEEDNTVKAIGSLTFETTYGYISAPLKERRKHEKLSNKHYNKKHKHKNKNYNNNNNNNNEGGGGVALIESLQATTNWADDDNEDEEEEEDDDDEEEEEIIPIDHIQNRWIPPSMRRKIDSDNAKTTTTTTSLENEILNNKANSNEVVVAKAKSTLNKLTVERFDKLSNIFATIVYENEDAVPEIAEVVVLKANAESHFASLYANLCVFICGAENINNNNHLMTEQLQDPKMRAVQLFKKSLLNHCQKLLNVVPDEANDLEYFQKPSPVKAKRDLDDSIDDDNEEALDKIALARKRYYGLVLFVGHLYKTKFLNCFIIHSMISNFLAGTPFLYGSIRPFFLVATCKLLEIVGKRLEYGDDEFKNKNDQGGEIGFNVEDEIEKRHVFNNKWMAFYVEVFNILLEKHDMLKKEVGNGDATDTTTTTNVDGIVLYAPRVIFAIRDLIELKQANWEPRKMNTVLKAKSLEQIKADRDAEEVRRKAELLASKLALKQQASHGREVDTDGFETVAVGGRRGRNEGKRLAKAKEYRINKAIAKGRNRHKGGGNNSKSPRHQHNNNNNNYHQQGGGGGGKPPRYNNNNNKNTYYNKGRNNNKPNNNSRRRNDDNNGDQTE